MTKERCHHVDSQIVDLVDRFQNWRGYECPYCEIEALKLERHQLRNELTAARLEGERLRNIVNGCPVCSELERNIKRPDEPSDGITPLAQIPLADIALMKQPNGCRCGECDRRFPNAWELHWHVCTTEKPEPNLLSITEAELNAALLPVAKHMNAQLRQYWAMPAKEFSELAWNALIDEMGSEQTNVLYALCARLSPEWEREAEEGAKIDPTPQKSLPAHLPNQAQWCQDPDCPMCASQRTGAKHAD